MKLAISAFLIFNLASFVSVMAQSNYSGQEQRELKSLSPEEISGYLAGKGMGLAKPAELNHFPGPKHVLKLATQLALSEVQRTQTETIYEAMRGKAIEYGYQLVKHEKEIERLFSEGDVSPMLLEKALNESAKIRAKLRLVHLVAHIEQKVILSQAQIRLYDKLRGYSGGHSGNEHKSHKH